MAWQETSDETPLFTYAMMAVFVAVFAAQLTGSDLNQLQAYPWRLGRGETWRLITSTTMHGGLLHFAFNMVMFLRFGTAIERWLGPWTAMGLYIFFAVGASAPQALETDGRMFSLPDGGYVLQLPAIGASGVVFGYFGFLWVVRRRYDIAAEVVTPVTIQAMLGWLAICFLINATGAFGLSIANSAHVAGLLFGWLVGQAVVARRLHRVPIILGTVLLCAALVSLTLKPVWVRTLANVPLLRDRYRTVLIDEQTAIQVEADQSFKARPLGAL